MNAPPAIKAATRLADVAPTEMLMAQSQPLKILVVDDEAVFRTLLQNLLEKMGLQVVAVGSGAEAVASFMHEQPDMVLMDVMMPGVDGYQATEYIRDLSGDSFIPIIFITAMSDENELAQCVMRGGNDFLTKPINPAVLQAKIEAFSQLRRLYKAVKSQRDELAQHNHWLKREYEIAEGVFAKVMHSSGLNSPNIKYMLSPQAIFNGDLLLAAYRPSGELHLMLGDFTGHGLSAAIGTIPVADIFNGMTAKGFPIPEIVAEINQKLQRILPRGLFLAAALMELDAKNHKLSAWVGGVPDILIYGAEHKALAGRFTSTNFPLGIMETDQLDCHVESMEVRPGDRIFLYTDGVPEARNSDHALFSQARLEQCFNDGYEPSVLYERILWELDQFRGTHEQSDDVTLIEVTVDPSANNPQAPSNALAPRPPSEWSASFEFSAESLRGYDPLPMMMQVLLETQRLHQHKQRIYMVLAELFLNALEHGLLKLDSSLKERTGGFGEYYQEKERRLAQLGVGRIKVRLRHAVNGSGGRLTIRVEDTGPGFDFQQRLEQLEKNQALHGRGITMIRSVCESLDYSGAGNAAEAVYPWRFGDGSE
ncbi:MAG: fused response regulator/phosphatase [Burkholderiales bacterium]|nr:fused response regulator/phosphatase [Burkholderiales bacterium]